VLCTPLRLVRYVERAEQKGAKESSACCYLDSRERGALRSASSVAALDTLSAEAALAIENARPVPRSAGQGEVRAGNEGRRIHQQALLPPGNRQGAFFLGGGGIGRLPRGRRRLLRLRRPAERRLSDSSSAMWPERDRRPHCWRRPSSACSARGHLSATAAPLMTRLNHGLFRRAIEARILTVVLRMLGP
jgi:hypothetical protein